VRFLQDTAAVLFFSSCQICSICYSGQTGSGKTFTMLGPSEEYSANVPRELRGVIPRSLDYLFQLIERKSEMVCLFVMSNACWTQTNVSNYPLGGWYSKCKV